MGYRLPHICRKCGKAYGKLLQFIQTLRTMGKDDLKDEYFERARSIEKEIDYSNNQSNVNKFIYKYQVNGGQS